MSIVHRYDVELVHSLHEYIGFLAGRQRADLLIEAVIPRAFDGRELNHLTYCEQVG